MARTPTAFDAIGYREIIAYLNGKQPLDEAVAAIKINTWHYAKRQMTWFKKDHAAHWWTMTAPQRTILHGRAFLE